MGTNVYFSDNKGQGIVIDPNTPRWANDGYQNERPYNYELLPSIFNFGIYLQDNFDFNLFNNPAKINAGLRYDNQNGSINLQPRINANYKLSKQLTLTQHLAPLLKLRHYLIATQDRYILTYHY